MAIANTMRAVETCAGTGAGGGAATRWLAILRSTWARAKVASTSATLDRANGMRGSIPRRVSARYGASALATPYPTMTMADSSGSDGFAAYLPSSMIGGARSADEVAVQMMVAAKNIHWL